MDTREELARFYERHIDEMTLRCMEVTSSRYPYSPLNTLPYEERLQWVRTGIRAIASDGRRPGNGTSRARVLSPRERAGGRAVLRPRRCD